MSEPSSQIPPADTHDPEFDTPNGAQFRQQFTAPGLTLVATPIGNLADMTFRGVAALREAELVLCEDTRVTSRLFTAHDISTKLAPLHEHNEDARTPDLIARMARGARIALVSDAGTPLLSDPGFRLVRAAIEAGIPVHTTPGANAALTGLVLSGLPPHPYMFLGFSSSRPAARQAGYAKLRQAERAGLSATLIWHEAPHRLAETLTDLAACFGARPAAVARELTKRFEEVRRGSLPELAAHYATAEARGEITLLVGPAPEEASDAGTLDEALLEALRTMSVRDAAAAATAATGLPRKQVYARALELSKADS